MSAASIAGTKLVCDGDEAEVEIELGTEDGGVSRGEGRVGDGASSTKITSRVQNCGTVAIIFLHLLQTPARE